MNRVIEEIQRNCLWWLEDSSPLLFDQKPGFEGADVHKDEVCNAQFTPQCGQLDKFTQIALEIIMGNDSLTIASIECINHIFSHRTGLFSIC